MSMAPNRLQDLGRRLEQAERRAKNLKRLLTLGQALTTAATKTEWPRRVAAEVLQAARCSWAAYCVSGREVDRLFLHRRSMSDPQLTIRPAGYLRRSAGDSWSSMIPCRLSGERFGLPAEESWYLPIRAHEQVLGGLLLPLKCLPNQRCGDTVELLSMLAHQVSFAVELSKLHNDVVKAATYDRMTGALNRGAWLERVQERLKRAKASQTQSGLILFDLDNFKEINDSLGHAAGDDYLIEAAQAARSALREEDQFGRFGGDEFVVWLEGVSPAVLNGVVERLMLKVGAVASRCQGKLREGAPDLGISVGVASVSNQTVIALDELLEAADAALYEAKAAGRGTWRTVRNSKNARAG
jgi:diguanylate cyclase (GGDEF)-like protein